jgi:glycosyltransferase involved in cell wall biosynthesis
MRVVVNGLSARLGGGQTYLHNILKCAPQEWRIFLLCPDNFNLTGLPANVTRIKSRLKLDNPFVRTAWEYIRLGKLAKTVEADILFCPAGLFPARGLPLTLKTVVTFQNMLPFDHTQRRRYKAGYRRLRDWLLEQGMRSAMRRADLIIFISRFAERFIEAKLGPLEGRKTMISHGVTADFFLSDKPLPLPPYAPKEPYFLYVSFIDHYKSQIEVVQAFMQVRTQSKTNEHLLLAGAENPAYGEALRREITRLRLEDVVHILGNLPHRDLPALYQSAKINLFASCTENCPNILLEMMASGRPALVSDRGPMPEFGGDCVTYFDPNHIEQLAGRWIAMLEQPEISEALAARARDRVSSMTWEKSAGATWKAMEDLAKESS